MARGGASSRPDAVGAPGRAPAENVRRSRFRLGPPVSWARGGRRAGGSHRIAERNAKGQERVTSRNPVSRQSTIILKSVHWAHGPGRLGGAAGEWAAAAALRPKLTRARKRRLPHNAWRGAAAGRRPAPSTGQNTVLPASAPVHCGRTDASARRHCWQGLGCVRGNLHQGSNPAAAPSGCGGEDPLAEQQKGRAPGDAGDPATPPRPTRPEQ